VVKFALFKNKVVQSILLIITIPLWLTILNFMMNFLIQAGRITGTFIRFISEGTICII